MKSILLAAISIFFLSSTSALAFTKDELVTIVALDAGISQLEARRAVESVFNRIMEAVANGNPAVIDGFGAFRAQQLRLKKAPAFYADPKFKNAVR